MAAGRVGADISQSSVWGDQDPPCRRGGGDHVRICRTGQPLASGAATPLTASAVVGTMAVACRTVHRPKG